MNIEKANVAIDKYNTHATRYKFVRDRLVKNGLDMTDILQEIILIHPEFADRIKEQAERQVADFVDLASLAGLFASDMQELVEAVREEEDPAKALDELMKLLGTK